MLWALIFLVFQSYRFGFGLSPFRAHLQISLFLVVRHVLLALLLWLQTSRRTFRLGLWHGDLHVRMPLCSWSSGGVVFLVTRRRYLGQTPVCGDHFYVHFSSSFRHIRCRCYSIEKVLFSGRYFVKVGQFRQLFIATRR